MTTLWYIDGATYLGTVIVRHQLTSELTRYGGHIGYHVAPRHRRQGHATAMLAAALAYCRDTLGLARVLVTCAEPNTASRRVIEGNGGILENTLDGECRYWADLTENPPRLGNSVRYAAPSAGCGPVSWLIPVMSQWVLGQNRRRTANRPRRGQPSAQRDSLSPRASPPRPKQEPR